MVDVIVGAIVLIAAAWGTKKRVDLGSEECNWDFYKKRPKKKTS